MWPKRFPVSCSWLLCLLVAMGCHAEHPQSVLHPASSAAAQITSLSWCLVALCALVFVVVMVLGGPGRRPGFPGVLSEVNNQISACGSWSPRLCSFCWAA
jgi:hypothetical protein